MVSHSDKIVELIQSKDRTQRYLALCMMEGMWYEECIDLLKTSCKNSRSWSNEVALRALFPELSDYPDYTFEDLYDMEYQTGRASLPTLTDKQLEMCRISTRGGKLEWWNLK